MATCGHCECAEWACEDVAKRAGFYCDSDNPFIPEPFARRAAYDTHLVLTVHCKEMRMDLLKRAAESIEQPEVCVVVPDDCAALFDSKILTVVVESALRKPEDYAALLVRHRVLFVPGDVGYPAGKALTGARGGKLWVYTDGVKPEWFQSVYLVRLVAWVDPDDDDETDAADDDETDAAEPTDDDETETEDEADDNPRPAKRVRFASPVVASYHPE